MTSASCSVPFGGFVHFSGSDASAPAHEKPSGIGSRSPNAGLVTVKRLPADAGNGVTPTVAALSSATASEAGHDDACDVDGSARSARPPLEADLSEAVAAAHPRAGRRMGRCG